MKEITRIVTMRMTFTGTVGDGERFMSKEEAAKIVKDEIMNRFNVDNVTIDNIQDFFMDKGEEDSEWKDKMMSTFLGRGCYCYD